LRLTWSSTVLTSDFASLLTEEFGRNAVVDDEAAFDIYPPLVVSLALFLPST
jgi:translation initiation factor IF-2